MVGGSHSSVHHPHPLEEAETSGFPTSKKEGPKNLKFLGGFVGVALLIGSGQLEKTLSKWGEG